MGFKVKAMSSVDIWHSEAEDETVIIDMKSGTRTDLTNHLIFTN